MRTSFVPRGYRRLKDIRKEVGHNELRQQLASGERSAFIWDPQNSQTSLQPIPTNHWLIADADEIIRSGKINPPPLNLADAIAERRIQGSSFAVGRKAKLVLIADVAKPKVIPLRAVNKGGRPPSADWDIVADALKKEFENRGFPEHGNQGWQTKADVEKWVADFLQARKETAGDTAIKDHVREIIEKLKAET
jgi:hypothetical protein